MLKLTNFITIVFYGISILCCSSIVMIILAIPKLYKNPVRIAICCLVASNIAGNCAMIVMTKQYQTDLLSTLVITGCLARLFVLIQMFWIVAISAMIFFVVKNGRPLKLGYLVHMICWVIPVLISLIPFVSSDIVKDKDNDIILPDYDVTWWQWESYYGPIILCIATVFFIQLYCQIAMRKGQLSLKRSCVSTLLWFPVIFMIPWTVIIIINLTFIHSSSFNSNLSQPYAVMSAIANILLSLIGTILAVTFWIVNPDIRGNVLCFITTGRFHHVNKLSMFLVQPHQLVSTSTKLKPPVTHSNSKSEQNRSSITTSSTTTTTASFTKYVRRLSASTSTSISIHVSDDVIELTPEMMEEFSGRRHCPNPSPINSKRIVTSTRIAGSVSMDAIEEDGGRTCEKIASFDDDD